MMILLKVMLVVLVVLILGVIAVGVWRTYKSEHSQNQTTFVQGSPEMSTLHGVYQGHVTGYTGAWQGKTIDQATSSGINRFQEGSGVVEKFPFRIYAAAGLRDRQLQVIRLDYNQPGNPWWLKYVVDEMVQVAPNTYLGKVHVRIAPRIVFTAGYFTLTPDVGQ